MHHSAPAESATTWPARRPKRRRPVRPDHHAPAGEFDQRLVDAQSGEELGELEIQRDERLGRRYARAAAFEPEDRYELAGDAADVGGL